MLIMMNALIRKYRKIAIWLIAIAIFIYLLSYAVKYYRHVRWLKSTTEIQTVAYPLDSRPFYASLERHSLGAAQPFDPFITVVTQYFRLDKSKYDIADYELWMGNFFRSVTQSPIVVYTDTRSLLDLLKLTTIGSNSTSITFYIVDSIWSVLKQLELDRGRLYVVDYLDYQPRIDPEKSIHNAELYAVWNAKSFLVNHTAHSNPYESAHFVYTDIGAFRDQIYPGWPDTSFVRAQLAPYLGDRVLFGQMKHLYENPGSSALDFVVGGFFAGNFEAVRTFAADFYAIHDTLLEAGSFVGKDQIIMNLLTHHRWHSHKIVRLTAPYSTRQCYGPLNKWFFYQKYLAGDTKCLSKRLSKKYLLTYNSI